YTVIGQHVNTAARLMEKSPPGHILVEESIASSMNGQYRFSSECGTRSQRSGSPNWFSAGRLTQVSSSLAFESDFVGRKDEIRRTEAFLRQSFSENRTSALFISGEAGIGKTRFACHLQSLLPETKLVYLKCDEILSKSLNPIESFFEEVFGISGAVSSRTSENVFDGKFRSVVGDHSDTEEGEYHAKNLQKLKYVIKGFMGINEKGEYSSLDARARFDNTILAFVHLLRLLASGRRLFVVLDDYQWIDSDSRSVMGDVFSQLDYRHPVLCVLTRPRRGGEQPAVFPEDSFLLKLDIGALERDEQMELATKILPCEPGDSLRERIEGLAEGNPLYIEQILLYMRERNMIRLSGGRAELPSSGVQLPGTVLDTIISRVDRLAPDVRRTVKVASVLGRRFNSRVLWKMLHSEPVDLHLDTGVSERIWNRHSEIQYVFRHALIRDAVYGMQMEKQLEELHLKAGNEIEKMYPEDARMFSDLSHHFLKCGDKTRMLQYTLKAAEYAKDNYRNREAMEMYSRYLQHQTDHHLRMQATLKLGEVKELVAQWDRAMAMYEEVLSSTEGSKHWELRVNSLMRIGFLKHRMGDNKEALDCFERAEAAYMEKDDTMGLATVYNNMGSAYLDLNDLSMAMDYFNRTLEITGSASESQKAEEITMFTYNNLGLVNQSMNRLDRALECYRNSMELAERLNSRRNLAPLNFGNIRFLQRKIGEAEKYYGIAMKNAEEIGDRHLVRVLLNNLAAISTVRGNYGKALEIYKKALLQALEMNDRKGIRLINQNIGEILAYMGRYREAEEALDRAIQTAEDLKDDKALGAALGKRGIMFYFRDSMKQSAESLKRAIPLSLDSGNWRNACEFAFFLAGAYYSLNMKEEIGELAEKLNGIPEKHMKHCIPWHLPAVSLYVADLNGNRDQVMDISGEITEEHPETEGEAVARKIRMKYLDHSENAEERARISAIYRKLNEENPVDYYRRMQETFAED
ncbi:MAG: tetratricopeptide repeat protein, partial [Candidatus Aegiribacteria sp.]|nr:tetratricopeptide repeat protein [Candidatus Aegiribacteria sp.]MBD3295009.1 tetratricopeptide repeat protein [Candidatus Fermentibacteria bacterium]